MIDSRSDRPLHRQLADALRERIRVGEWRPGTYLPSEAAIQQEYGVGKTACRNALDVLRRQRLVVTEAGRGTMVRMPPERTRVAIPRGAEVLIRPAADEDEEAALDLEEGEMVAEVRLGGRTRSLHAAERTIFTTA
ncbi:MULTISPECIES: GntR family transcriptional regulator [Catenuloplanes]|uniref:GntR family transcriptional regulator n=1 Tax=Catenuloplanes niger TaxID=587534 RepID=A0AAE3ZR14_9ACTN|nr:GntR family transcriptional regulator [Catenuloplanes niger]MDR7323346.1 GntR family transcriptional regulator [Catenuloplanes niger]